MINSLIATSLAVMATASFSDRECRCPCVHRRRFPATKGTRTPLEMMNKLYERPTLIPLVPHDLFSWEERMLGDEGRLADYIFLDFRPATLQPFPLTMLDNAFAHHRSSDYERSPGS